GGSSGLLHARAICTDAAHEVTAGDALYTRCCVGGFAPSLH
ncbi:jg12989, partial [Pararge aegeria aegeria]